MSTLKYGESEWEEGEVSGGRSGSDFMNLGEGENVVRIVTKPYVYYVAWVRDTSGVNRKIRSAAENCPLALAGHAPKPRYYVGVLDRSSGEVKILEIGNQVYKAIVSFKKDPDYGDPLNYDIKIIRAPKGSSPSSFYTVLPKPPKPLTKEEKALVEAFNKRVDISKFTKPPTPEEVAEKLGVVLGHDKPAQVAVGHQKVPAKVEKPAILDEDFANFGDDEDL